MMMKWNRKSCYFLFWLQYMKMSKSYLKKVTDRDIKKETNDIKEQIEVLQEYYKYIEQKNNLDKMSSSIETFIKISWCNPNELRYKDIIKMIKKYGMETTTKSRNIFCDSDIEDEKYFFWICKNVDMESKDTYYKEKMKFYYDYIQPCDDKYKSYKKIILSYERDAIQYYLENYWCDIEWIRYNVWHDEFRVRKWLSVYKYGKMIIDELLEYKKALLSDIKDF